MANERILIDNDSLVDIGSAIREKNGESTTYKPSEMPSAIRALGAGDIVNGIVKRYMAKTKTVNADMFVEFVKDSSMPIVGKKTVLVENYNTDEFINSVKLDDKRVLLIFPDASSNAYLCGVVCYVDDDNITAGEVTQLSSEISSGLYTSAVKLTENVVFIVHYDDDLNLNGMICTVNGGTITPPGASTTISTSGNLYTSIVRIDSETVFIAYKSYQDNNIVNGIVCTINGTTITYGTETTILTLGTDTYGNFDYLKPSTVYLGENHVFVVCGNCAIVCEILNLSISLGTQATFSYRGLPAKAIALSETKIFLIFSTRANQMYATICTISGTTITFNASSAVALGGVFPESTEVKLSDNEVLVIYVGYNTGVLNRIICTVDGTTITLGEEVEIISDEFYDDNIDSLVLEDGIVFFVYSISGVGWYGSVLGKKYVKQTYTKIEGLTKAQCTTSTVGDVFILNANN